MRHPALAEADDLRMGLDLSVEQRKRAGFSRTIDYYCPFRRMSRRLTKSVDWLHVVLHRPLTAVWANATRDPAAENQFRIDELRQGVAVFTLLIVTNIICDFLAYDANKDLLK